MERTDHCFFVGTGAEQLAEELGFELVENGSLVHEIAQVFIIIIRNQPFLKLILNLIWIQKRLNDYKTFERTINDDKPKDQPKPSAQIEQSSEHDTVGAVAIDKDGNVAVATSTGGLTAQKVGRVGDSPIIGAGGYADNICGAVSTTGHGEAIMRTCLARHIMYEYMNGQNKEGSPTTLQKAVDLSLQMMAKRVDGYGGAIAVGSNGQIGIGFSTSMMSWAYVNSTETEPTVHFGIREGEHFTEKLWLNSNLI